MHVMHIESPWITVNAALFGCTVTVKDTGIIKP